MRAATWPHGHDGTAAAMRGVARVRHMYVHSQVALAKQWYAVSCGSTFPKTLFAHDGRGQLRQAIALSTSFLHL